MWPSLIDEQIRHSPSGIPAARTQTAHESTSSEDEVLKREYAHVFAESRRMFEEAQAQRYQREEEFEFMWHSNFGAATRVGDIDEQAF